MRYAPAGASDTLLNAVNDELLLRLQESGVAVPSSTMLDGRFAIRVANVNHRARREDIDMMLDAILQIGRQVIDEMS
jgi:hypothetical protein